MKASDIVTQLVTILPQLTAAFTRNVDVTNVQKQGSELLIETAVAHEVKTGDPVSLVGAQTPISVALITRAGTVLTIITPTDHDITYNPEVDNVAPQVTVEGANEAEFNDTFTVAVRVNKRALQITVADSGATTGTGTIIMFGAQSFLFGYNLPYAVQSTPTATSLLVTDPATSAPVPLGAMQLRIKPRIAGEVTADDAVLSYSKQPAGDFWLYAVLGTVAASRDLKSMSDATIDRRRVHYFRQQVMMPFDLFVFVPKADKISARAARDSMEDLFPLICRSILFHQFPSSLIESGVGTVGFLDHVAQGTGDAFYTHRFSFMQVVDLNYGDTVGDSDSVAMRKITLTMTPSTGDDTMTTEINF